MKNHHALLITGSRHHDSKTGPKAIAAALKSADVRVTTAPDAASLTAGKFDVAVLYAPGDCVSEEDVSRLANFVRAGGGLVAIHCGNGNGGGSEACRKLLGSRLVSHSSTPIDFAISVSDADHPIAHRMQGFRIRDQLHAIEPMSEFRTFLTAWWDGHPQPIAYTKTEGAGRIVCLANGHEEAALNNPSLQKVLARSARFAAGEDWSDKTVKVAAIGYGVSFSMGRLHLDSCRRARLTPMAVCDSDSNRTNAAKSELGGPIETYDSAEDLLANSDCELCIIITPHNTHAPLAIQCLEAGRHVVCEKPFTITIDEATAVSGAPKWPPSSTIAAGTAIFAPSAASSKAAKSAMSSASNASSAAMKNRAPTGGAATKTPAAARFMTGAPTLSIGCCN